MQSFHCFVTEEGENKRLDTYISQNLELLSRSQLAKRGVAPTVNGKPAKLSKILRENDELFVEWREAEPVKFLAERLPLDILYEDEDVIVVNKAAGLVVHPGAGNRSGTLVNGLLWHFEQKTGHHEESFPNAERPFIAHRLDKDTSGVLIAAWHEGTLRFLQDQFKSRAVKKTYIAIVHGAAPSKAVMDNYLCRSGKNRKIFMVSPENCGKRAITRLRLVKIFQKQGEVFSLLTLRPKTGRTHQLRVQLSSLGFPILGDPLYGKPSKAFPSAPLRLHASRLQITLPNGVSGDFRAPSPFPVISDTLSP
jgi:23S rRNA pseudouridine1911/1915/1917 synthase